jgi:hypothetical protein
VKNPNRRNFAQRANHASHEKVADFREKSKLARLLHSLLASGRMVRPLRNQGVIIMSIVKFQSAALALVGAVMVASLFIGAAVPVTPIA